MLADTSISRKEEVFRQSLQSNHEMGCHMAPDPGSHGRNML